MRSIAEKLFEKGNRRTLLEILEDPDTNAQFLHDDLMIDVNELMEAEFGLNEEEDKEAFDTRKLLIQQSSLSTFRSGQETLLSFLRPML